MIDSLLSSHQAVILANGRLPSPHLTQKLSLNKFILATDGGYNKAIDINITPNITIGDKDSISPHHPHGPYLHIEDQNTTDLEKTILYCVQHNLQNVLVLGAFGGELDHSINNLMSLSKYSTLSMQFSLLDQYSPTQIKIGLLLNQNAISFSCPLHSTISILPLPFTCVSTSGLFWNLSNSPLTFDQLTSARNYNAQENVSIHCLQGKCMIIIDHTLPS